LVQRRIVQTSDDTAVDQGAAQVGRSQGYTSVWILRQLSGGLRVDSGVTVTVGLGFIEAVVFLGLGVMLCAASTRICGHIEGVQREVQAAHLIPRFRVHGSGQLRCSSNGVGAAERSVDGVELASGPLRQLLKQRALVVRAMRTQLCLGHAQKVARQVIERRWRVHHLCPDKVRMRAINIRAR